VIVEAANSTPPTETTTTTENLAGVGHVDEYDHNDRGDFHCTVAGSL
jgi:hypothetical protein